MAINKAAGKLYFGDSSPRVRVIDLATGTIDAFAGYTGGWGYAQFNYDAASDTFKPLGTGANCGFACHTIVKAKDYVFTAYPKR